MDKVQPQAPKYDSVKALEDAGKTVNARAAAVLRKLDRDIRIADTIRLNLAKKVDRSILHRILDR